MQGHLHKNYSVDMYGFHSIWENSWLSVDVAPVGNWRQPLALCFCHLLKPLEAVMPPLVTLSLHPLVKIACRLHTNSLPVFCNCLNGSHYKGMMCRYPHEPFFKCSYCKVLGSWFGFRILSLLFIGETESISSFTACYKIAVNQYVCLSFCFFWLDSETPSI